jgi:uncharacterized protein (TIGR01244 family)
VHAIPLVFALVVAAAGGPTAPPQTVDAGSIPNYRLVHPGLAAAGQPAPEALAKLAAVGFRTVVNLRSEKEVPSPVEERATVEAQGLRYVWVPITAESFSLADVEAVEKVLRDPAKGPVLLHCASSNRVGAVWAAIQAREGKPLEEALAAGREAGLRSPQLEEAVRRMVEAPAPSAP